MFWTKPSKGESRLMLLSLLAGGISGYSLSKKYNTNPIVGSIGGGIIGFYVFSYIGLKIKLDRVLGGTTSESVRMQMTPTTTPIV
jgi:hypothetical protein